MNKFRKKGQLFIEFIIVFPIMLISLWLIIQIFIYVNSNNQVDHAADSGAMFISQRLRGSTGDFSLNPNKTQIIADLHTRMEQTLSDNGFVLYNKNADGTPRNLDSFEPIIFNDANCTSSLEDKTNTRVLCILTKVTNVGGKSQEQIIVRLKVPFKVIGTSFPGLEDKISLYGNGASTKDISGTFQYY